jgi:hypothetical protein
MTDVIVHELGHTLGLYHEFTRPDAYAAGVSIDCQEIEGFEDVRDALLTTNPKLKWPPTATHGRAGQEITLADVCYYGELSSQEALDQFRLPFHELWAGDQFLAAFRDPVTGLDRLGFELSSVSHGIFDWRSCMMYSTWQTNDVLWDTRTGQNVRIPRRFSPCRRPHIEWKMLTLDVF